MPYQIKTLELNNQYVNNQKMNIEVIYEYTDDREMPFLDIVDILQLSTGWSVIDVASPTEFELIKQEVEKYESSFRHGIAWPIDSNVLYRDCTYNGHSDH